MTQLEKIELIETKIVEIKNILETWTTQITSYHTTLDKITDQLEQIKKNIN
ncbi:MAG: hypothetical protein I3274_02820 [Candidatus Moeniiplasma glomeromycotorum]|nr:hypothetical protein [Candidatus Moeniiplasma glomeromycotorum]MCE8167538.1 hypothetical protein [Candidatus Moeniiplasma glomeromycotorum]